jgi:hypothetical protein
MMAYVVVETKNNALTIVVEGTQTMEEEIAKVGCVATKMKPCDLEKYFEGNAQQAINPP